MGEKALHWEVIPSTLAPKQMLHCSETLSQDTRLSPQVAEASPTKLADVLLVAML